MMSQIIAWFVYAAFCAGVSCGSLLITIVYLRSVALAAPNHRSGHEAPTPQGAGLVVIPVALMGMIIALWATGERLPVGTSAPVIAGAGALGLMFLGFADDVRGMGIAVRLCAQAAVVAAVVLALPPEFRIGPSILPIVAERIIIFVALLWFINVANFMDGMDWMSVTETVAITFGIMLLALSGSIDSSLGWCAVALMGAMIGFMPFNMHPAKVFLGDAGSLPLGLLLGVLLLNVFAEVPTAALILPLYYLADATITLLSRVIRRKQFWEAHREHFYQRALRNGASVSSVLWRLVSLNAALILFALIGASVESWTERLGMFVLAVVAVAATLVMLGSRPKRER